MVICKFCGEVQDDTDALQLHHALDCSGIKLDETNTNGNQVVEFVWIPDDENITEEVVYLLGSYLVNNIELHYEEGVYKSSPTEIQYGDFSGQLVIADDIVPVNEFRIDLASDVIYLTRNADLTALEETNGSKSNQQLESNYDFESEPDSPVEEIAGRSGHGDSGFMNLLSEEKFNDPSLSSFPTSPREAPQGDGHDENTLKHVDELQDDDHESFINNNIHAEKDIDIQSSDESHNDALEEQELDDVIPTNRSQPDSVQSFPSHDRNNISVADMMSELQMSEQEDVYTDRKNDFLPSNVQHLPSEPSFKSHFDDEQSPRHHASNDGSPRMGNVQHLPSERSFRSHIDNEQSPQHHASNDGSPRRGNSADSRRSDKSLRSGSAYPVAEEVKNMQFEKDQLTTQYQLECEKHKQEMEKVNSELSRLQQLTENYKEVKLELETKCLSYSIEVERLKNEIQKQQQILKEKEMENENLVKDMLFDKQELSKRCQHLELDLQKKQLDLEEMAHQFRKSKVAFENNRKEGHDDQLVAELEAKCQSYDIQIERLAEEKDEFKGKFIDSLAQIKSLSSKYNELEKEKQKLNDENQSLETANLLNAEEVKSEREHMNLVVKKLQNDIAELQSNFKNNSLNHSSKGMDIEARQHIEKLNRENKLLKEKLKLIRVESDVTNNNAPTSTSSPILHSTLRTSPIHSPVYQPHIVSSSRKETMGGSHRTPEHLRSKTFTHNTDHTLKKSDDLVDNYSKRMLPSRYNPSDYTSSSRRTHSPPVSVALSSRHVMNGSFDDRLEKIMRRYSGDSKKMNQFDQQYFPNGRTNHDQEHEDESYFQKRRSSKRFSPKSRSLDLGLDSIGLSEDDSIGVLSKRYDSMNRVPFCPTTIEDLRMGMKVSVSRTSGRLSRGIVKWIGTLPNRVGEFVGVELETESGKHDGFFDGVRFFKCKPDRGVFVKFNKVIMAWR